MGVDLPNILLSPINYSSPQPHVAPWGAQPRRGALRAPSPAPRRGWCLWGERGVRESGNPPKPEPTGDRDPRPTSVGHRNPKPPPLGHECSPDPHPWVMTTPQPQAPKCPPPIFPPYRWGCGARGRGRADPGGFPGEPCGSKRWRLCGGGRVVRPPQQPHSQETQGSEHPPPPFPRDSGVCAPRPTSLTGGRCHLGAVLCHLHPHLLQGLAQDKGLLS